MKPPPHKVLRHIPNALTVTRLMLCPLIVYFFLTAKYVPGLLLFSAACATDFLDGYLARRFNAGTALGALLDPISDKLFTLSFFSLLMVLGSCPVWFLGLWISVNLLQCLGYFLIKHGRDPHFRIAPLRIAKWNTSLQFAWIGVVFVDIFLRYRFPHNFRFSFLFHFSGYTLLAAMQTVVFFRYFFRFRPVLFPDFRSPSPAR